jgi:hypothetical protein
MTMAGVLRNETSENRLSAVTMDTILGSRVLIPVLATLVVATVAVFAYAAREYVNADCYASMKKAGLNRDGGDMLDDVAASIVALRKGSPSVSKWSDGDFQGTLKDARQQVEEARQALKAHDALALTTAVVDVEKTVAQAKALATNRVNFILGHQDPQDFDSFEKYRLEGRNLVATVRELDAVLETLSEWTKRIPKGCS